VLRVGATPVFSTVAGYDRFAPTRDYLIEALGEPVTVVQRSTYFEINELLRSGDLDVAFASTGAYVLNGGGLEVVAVPERDGETAYRAVCVVNEDSDVRSFEDLRGAAFGLGDPLSLAGRLYTQARLRELGSTPDEFFGHTFQVEGHDALLRLVAGRSVDAACVSSAALDRMAHDDVDVAAACRLLEQSPPLAAPPVVVSQHADPDLRAALRKALLAMDTHPAGRAALSELGYDRFIEPSPDLYDELRELAINGGTPVEP